VKKYSRKFCKL